MRTIKRNAFWIGLLLWLSGMCGGCVSTPPWQLVNNTGYDVKVVQDGKDLATMHTGQAIKVPGVWLGVSHISVLAYDNGRYIGANSYTFGQAAYNWQVDHVFLPEGARP